MLTVGSLFAGIGGFDLGLERAGMRSVWQCEIDPYAQRVLARHWPDVLRVSDIRDVGAGTVPYVDVICGGFPCQDISLAGDGIGIEGARSGLWSEYARVVGELRPRYVVVENVAALLRRGMGTVLGDLAALGYDAEWDCIPASTFGAPHQRDRIWLVAYPGGEQHEGSSAAERGATTTGLLTADPDADLTGRGVVAQHDGGALELGGRPPRRHTDRLRDEVADAPDLGHERPGQARNGRPGPAHGSRGGRGEQAGTGFADWWAVEPDVGRVAHGVPARVDRLRCLGNALVPAVAEWIGTRIIEWESGLT